MNKTSDGKDLVPTQFEDSTHYNFGCKKYVPYFFEVIHFALKGVNNYGAIYRNYSFDHMTIGESEELFN